MFYRYNEIKTYLECIEVEVFYLPAYSPDLNSTKNVFGFIKQRLDGIKARALISLQLKTNISVVIEGLGEFTNYYRHFGQKINEIVNRIK